MSGYLYLESGSTSIRIMPYTSGPVVRFVEPPLIGDDPIAYAPGQLIQLSAKGTRALFNELKVFYAAEDLRDSSPEVTQ